MHKTLAGKVALVTGGSRGIGAACAPAMAAEGANVAITYLKSAGQAQSVARELQDSGVEATALQVDHSDSAQVKQLIAQVIEGFGQLDILLNNAGVSMGARVDDAGADLDAIHRMFAINYQSVVTATRAAATVMSEGGRIINIGSVLGSRPSFAGLADYAATKAALVGFSKGAARDLFPRKITVNVIESGSVMTEMNPQEGAFAEAQKALIALGRFGYPEEIAAGVVFLASPAASFITGSVLTIDGGFGA